MMMSFGCVLFLGKCDRIGEFVINSSVIVSECCDRLKAVSVLLNNGMLQTVYTYSSHHATLDFFTSLD